MKKRTTNKPQYRPQFEKYEQLKQKWIFENPKATHEAYQKAISQIALRCGI